MDEHWRPMNEHWRRYDKALAALQAERRRIGGPDAHDLRECLADLRDAVVRLEIAYHDAEDDAVLASLARVGA